MKALDRAIAIKGTVQAFASALGLAQSTPCMWKKRGKIPAEHCLAIEAATDGLVRCEELRPDVNWAVLRGTAPAKERE